MHGKQPSGLLTQKKMLHSAISLFLEKGYEKATTAEIARGAGMTPSAFFRAYPSKEALLLELVKQMFDNQFAEAERRTGEMDQLMMYAVETALQMHLAELSESMRDLYVTAYSLPSTAAYIYRNTAKRLQTIFSPYLPSLQEKDFYELDIALRRHHARLHGRAVRSLFHNGAEASPVSGLLLQALRCAEGAA